MTDSQPPAQNRRSRRAAAKTSNQPQAPPTATPKIKMRQPDRSGPKTKTLLDLYEEKKSLLHHGQPFSPDPANKVSTDESGSLLNAGLHHENDEEDEPIGPLGEAVFWSLALGMLHFTLDVLVYSQYRQEIEWTPIFSRSGTMVPVLFFLVYLLRSETAATVPRVRQAFFFVVAVGAGCYTIHVANRYDYYAVMKRTPPLGTLWVWSVIELRLALAAASVGVDLGFLWWRGYTMF